MLKNKKPTFFCFSPPVMIATFVIEIILLVALMVTRRMQKITILIGASLLALAFFQLCEYFVCGGLGVNAAMWSRLGFVAITTLPPLGLHIIFTIGNKKSRFIVPGAYLLMMGWIMLFGFTEAAFQDHVCSGNYVIFSLQSLIGYLYSAYYYGLLLLGILCALQFGSTAKKKHTREAYHGMIIGYLTFLVPTAVANTIEPSTMAGIPSIMCGFAIFFAFILFGYILPRVASKRDK